MHARFHHQVRDVPKEFNIGICEKSSRDTFATSSPSAAHTVDIGDNALREVIVNHVVDCFEVYSTGHQVRADQHPDLAEAEVAHDLVSLVLLAVRVDHIRVHTFTFQLVIELFCSVLRLNKYEHGWFKSIPNELPQGAQLTILLTHIHNLLFNSCSSGVSDTNLYFKHRRTNAHYSLPHMVLYTRLHSSRKQELSDVFVAILKD